MKKNLLFLSLLLIITVTSGCGDNNSSSSEQKLPLSVTFYIDNGSTISPVIIPNKSTLTGYLDKQFSIYLKTENKSLNVVSKRNYITIDNDNNFCICTLNSAGNDTILVSTTDNSVRDTTYCLYVNIKGNKLDYTINANIDTIDVQSVEMKEKIKEEMEQKYMPVGSILTFKYVTDKTGYFINKYYATDSVMLTFETAKDENTDFYSILNNKQCCQTIDINYLNGKYTIVQDFTSELQNEYPTAGIKKAIIYSTATKSSTYWAI